LSNFCDFFSEKIPRFYRRKIIFFKKSAALETVLSLRARRRPRAPWKAAGKTGSGARRRRFFFGKSGRGSGLPADGRMYYDEGMKSSARLLLGICLFVKIAALAPQAEAVPACGTRLTNASAPARDALALPESREELGASEQSFESPLFSPVRGALQTGLKRFRKEPFRTAQTPPFPGRFFFSRNFPPEDPAPRTRRPAL
jgi:hypothetical protein